MADVVSDGRAHGVRTLQECLCRADRVPVSGQRGEKLQVSSAGDIEAVVVKDHPLLARHRLALAASEALVDLWAQGVVVPVAEAPDETKAHPMVSASVIIEYSLDGYGASVPYETELPAFARAYRLNPRLAHDGTLWIIEPDLFTADIEPLQLDSSTDSCISEALDAYRHGLYLSSANMLGAASEGAWYAAGERLRHLDSPLAKALDAESTAKVMHQVAHLMRQTKGQPKDLLDELHSQAALLKVLRNYGVHPRGKESDHLRQYFSEAGATVLLMQTHAYLVRLAGAVDARLAQDAGSGGATK